MKKNITLMLIILSMSATVNAQYALGVGDKQLNAGFGFSSYGLPVYLGFDFGVETDISVGFQGSFRNYNHRWDSNRYRSTIVGLGLNGNYHFGGIASLPTNVDIYAGLNIGFYIWDHEFDYPGARTSGLGLGGQAGFRYYFNEKFAINLELGGGYQTFGDGKIGVSVKL